MMVFWVRVWRFWWVGLVLLLAWALIWTETRIGEAEMRPPPGVPAALRLVGLDGRGGAFVFAEQTDAMVRRSRAVPAGVLADAIRGSAAAAARAGTREMPDEIAELLALHYGRLVVEDVRWTVRGQRLELGSLLTAWVLEDGAVTLGRVVVFDHRGLTDNLWLWAHELAHVEQYRRLGVDGFAAAYLADWEGMEAEATARGNAVVAEIRAERANAPVRWLGPGD